jgi:adenylate cyclase
VTDFAAEGLLEGVEGRARESRERLLRELHEQGVELEELRQAVEEDRLALLPVDRVLSQDEALTPREIAERTGVTLDELKSIHAAFGLPVYDDDDPRFSETDATVAEGLRSLLDAGIPMERISELNRVVGRSMLQVAASSRQMVAEALFAEGRTEYEIATMAAAAARELTPRMAPVLAYAYERHLRELLRSDVLGAADVAAGRPAGAREMGIAFADLVGFTRLGEQLPPEELSDLARRLETIAAERVCPPVQLAKTVGDAVMLVSKETDPLIETALDLLEAADAEGGTFPQLRVGIAHGPAQGLSGDWFGSPVNQASRVTGVARAGSVLATDAVRQVAEHEWRWSFAGERRLRGVGPTRLFRARRPETERG